MTVRGDGVPGLPMASMRIHRMGPPPRSVVRMRITASCFRASGTIGYKDVARTIVHHTRATLDVVIADHNNCAVVLGAVKDEALRWRSRAILDRYCARRRHPS